VIYRRICVALLPLMLSACASDPAPNEQLRLTEQALSQAKALGISAEQSASLRLAEEKLALAQAAMQDEDYKQARVHAEQAELDARLAEAEHLTEKSQQQLAELSNAINRLRKQLGGLQ
jgi:chromosome segregation ATPase